MIQVKKYAILLMFLTGCASVPKETPRAYKCVVTTLQGTIMFTAKILANSEDEAIIKCLQLRFAQESE